MSASRSARVQTTTLGPLTVSRFALGALMMGDKTSPNEAETSRRAANE